MSSKSSNITTVVATIATPAAAAAAMGAQFSKQVERRKAVAAERRALADLLESAGDQFPGSDFRPADRKAWMSALGPDKLRISQIVWPGTHDSATNKIGVRFVSRPFARCQDCSVYRQLVNGARLLDIRVQEDRRICHGILVGYSVDVVIKNLKKYVTRPFRMHRHK